MGGGKGDEGPGRALKGMTGVVQAGRGRGFRRAEGPCRLGLRPRGWGGRIPAATEERRSGRLHGQPGAGRFGQEAGWMGSGLGDEECGVSASWSPVGGPEASGD